MRGSNLKNARLLYLRSNKHCSGLSWKSSASRRIESISRVNRTRLQLSGRRRILRCRHRRLGCSKQLVRLSGASAI